MRELVNCCWSCLVRGLPNDGPGSMLSVVTVVLLRVSSVNSRRGLTGDVDWSPTTSVADPKADQGDEPLVSGDPPRVVLG